MTTRQCSKPKTVYKLFLVLTLLVLVFTGCKSEETQIIPLPLGEWVSGSITNTQEQVLYGLTTDGRQHLFFDFKSLSATAAFTLQDPQGNIVFQYIEDAPEKATVGPVILEEAGTYTYAIKAQKEALSYEFFIWHIDPPSLDQTLTFDMGIRGHTNIPGQKAVFTFEGRKGQSVYFDYSALNTWADIKLENPDGTTAFAASAWMANNANAGPIPLTMDGTYVYTLSPQRRSTLAYHFKLWDIDPPVIQRTFNLGATLDGETAIPGQSVAYTFSGTKDKEVYFDYIHLNTRTRFTLTDPMGNTFYTAEGYSAASSNSGALVLPIDGVYTYTMEPLTDQILKYSFVADVYYQLQEERPDFILDVSCGVWSNAQAGGAGTTIDTWDISKVQEGSLMVFKYEAFHAPDQFIVVYGGQVVLDTGWVGSREYNMQTGYGEVGQSSGEQILFTKVSGLDALEVTIIGHPNHPRTEWQYQLKCEVR